jgi:importin subunit beta-1
MEDLIKVLERTVSSNQADQNEAVRYIQEFCQKDFIGFIQALSDVLYEQQNPPVVRAAAGLQLKNQLTARDEYLRQQQQERWRSLPEPTRTHIKERVFKALGTEIFRPSSAPQCVAYIALIELPEQQWPGLIPALEANVTSPTSTQQLKLASLEAIGYICQDIDQTCIQASDSNHILNAIVLHGMKDDECDEVKLAATTALLNSLEFTETNFKAELERDHIMRAVCSATQSSNTQICVVALQCLVKIMSLYYQYMDRYMSCALYAITTNAMKSENDDIALQGIEFWSNVCDEEITLAGEAAEAQESGEQPERVSKQYALQALPSLVPILVEMLARQDEHDDTEEWKPCKSAGVCLMLLANCCENAIVGHVLPYIFQNVSSDDWRRRDAAVMTFGSILDGPDQHTLQPIAVQIVPALIQFMRDVSVVVRDSAAWAIGKLCDTVPEAVLQLPHDVLDSLVNALANNLKSEPRVASNVCWAINSLVSAAGESARATLPPDTYPTSFLLSDYLPSIFQNLLNTTERQESAKDQEHNLRSAAYEALMAVIKAAPIDCYTLVYPTTFQIVLQRIHILNENIQRPEMNAPEIRAQLHDFLSLLWTTLSACIRRMEKAHLTPDQSDNIMQNLLLTLNNSADSGATQEDVFMTASTLLEVVGIYFSRYMEVFKPFLIVGLTNSAVPQLNITAIGLLSDLSRILGEDLLPHCSDFMNALLTKLREDTYDKNAKAQILSIFGDFALAFGPRFEPWISGCLDMLHQASQIQPADRTDYDLVDYCIKLRECAIEGYTGIIQGMKDKDARPNQELCIQLQPRIPVIIQFIEVVASDPDMTDNLLCSCCGLVGDIVETFGAAAAHLVASDRIRELLMKGKRSRSEKTQTIANWAYNVVRRVIRSTVPR